MTDPRDARIAELEKLLKASETARQAEDTARQAAETARQAAEEELAFILACMEVLVAYIRQQQRGGPLPLSCPMAARLV